MTRPGDITDDLQQARVFASTGQDAAARGAYVGVLRRDPTHFAALNELASLALSGGYASAARTAQAQAVRHHPGNPVGRINLANLLLEEGDIEGARRHYGAALAIAPGFAPAHHGMARVLGELGEAGADHHWRHAFAEGATTVRPYRGTGDAIPVWLLVAARGGNIPTARWLDDRTFAVTALTVDFASERDKVPDHALVVNAIGDADLCGAALRRAEAVLAAGTAPVMNPPARVRATGRVETARYLARVPGVITARTARTSRAALRADPALRFPLLLRAPGFHSGRHFVRVAAQEALEDALAELPGEALLAMEWRDAQGADGCFRKYRVMAIGGALYPLHLAISRHWKVHYFTADMAQHPAHREEERRFLDDMPRVLGGRAMEALHGIAAQLGLDYAGIDFALAADGSVLLFEANATMVINPPGPQPMWDYRRRAAQEALDAVTRMLRQLAGGGTVTPGD